MTSQFSIRAHTLLRRFYGYDSFRPGQLDIITAVARDRRDALVLMPTGGGKSLCFQMSALLLDGLTIVISPLIALMDDQVRALTQNGIPAATVHSGRDEADNRRAFADAAAGRLKLLYISPERLVALLPSWPRSVAVSLIAVDEAHCISQWGHDFRPVYTSLSSLKAAFPGVPFMALTATADRLTRDDIATQLALSSPFIHVGSFDRPNLSLRVIPDPGRRARIKFISAMIRKYVNDAGIVYTLSRKNAEDVDADLRLAGFRSACYHAGMSAADRADVQRRFSDGSLQVICATIAFGMGIDKSNIRWVIHNNMPANIECYYQEIGRAGRDGLPAETVMFYSLRDVILRRSFADESGRPDLNVEKLALMQHYAESDVCRRRILLSYFSEKSVDDCGNCDNCTNPPQRFDGTVIAQKAISAVIRTSASVGASMLVDILRGSAREELVKAGWHQIKTYGAGRDIPARHWSHFITQMIQLGLLEIAYDDNFHLRPTPYGLDVVRGNATVMLSMPRDEEKSRSRRGKPAAKPAVTDPVTQLFEQLKTVRRQIARDQSVPDYIIFNDASLLDMARRRPVTIDDFARVHGAGERKTVRYGKRFIQAIRKFEGLSASMPQGTSVKETLILFNAGETVDSIAALKNIAPATVYSHIVRLIDEDMLSSFGTIINRRQLEAVRAIRSANPPDWDAAIAAAGIDRNIASVCLAVIRYHDRHSPA